jgi:hypothetical protein
MCAHISHVKFYNEKKFFGKVAIVTQPVAAGQYKLHIWNTLKCNQIKNVHIGENGQGPLLNDYF